MCLLSSAVKLAKYHFDSSVATLQCSSESYFVATSETARRTLVFVMPTTMVLGPDDGAIAASPTLSSPVFAPCNQVPP